MRPQVAPFNAQYVNRELQLRLTVLTVCRFRNSDRPDIVAAYLEGLLEHFKELRFVAEGAVSSLLIYASLNPEDEAWITAQVEECVQFLMYCGFSDLAGIMRSQFTGPSA